MTKVQKVILITICLFIIGIILVFQGFLKGDEIAYSLARTTIHETKLISEGLISACTYTIVIAGISAIICSIISGTIVFYQWLTR